jgi:hypothetical protein
MNAGDKSLFDQCALRLPFHVNGTLDAEWQEPMRSALGQSDQLRHSAAWLAALRTELRAVSARENHHASWQRILQSIDLPASEAEPSHALSDTPHRARWRLGTWLVLCLAAGYVAVRLI